MMIPSKIWIRSLSPSRTLTCTRTVSPDFIRGRSVSFDCSTSSSALITALHLAGLKDPPYMWPDLRPGPTSPATALAVVPATAPAARTLWVRVPSQSRRAARDLRHRALHALSNPAVAPAFARAPTSFATAARRRDDPTAAPLALSSPRTPPVACNAGGPAGPVQTSLPPPTVGRPRRLEPAC